MDILNSWGKGPYLGTNILSAWYFALATDTAEARHLFKDLCSCGRLVAARDPLRVMLRNFRLRGKGQAEYRETTEKKWPKNPVRTKMYARAFTQTSRSMQG